MAYVSSLITSLSCSPTSVMAEDVSGIPFFLQWLTFIFLSPCSQRTLLSAIDVLFLLIIFFFAIQKLYSRLKSGNNAAIDEPLITKTRPHANTNLWFKLSLLSTTILAVLSIVLSILAFTQNTQIPWKLTNGICWLIQALTFLVIAILIIHEKRFQAVTHPVLLRVFWTLNFIVIALFASSATFRLVSRKGNTPSFESEDIISLISLPFSFFLLIVSITRSTGITVAARESEWLNGNGEVSEDDELKKSSKVSGWESTSIPSKVFWLWMNPLLTKGYTTPLKIDDIPTLSPDRRAEKWPKPEENSKHPVRTTLFLETSGIHRVSCNCEGVWEWSTAYVAQTAWIQNGTIQDNI